MTDMTCNCVLHGRRGFLRLSAAGLLAATLAPTFARAAEGDYEAMVLACIDPRFQEPVHGYLGRRGLAGKYSQFTVAGAAIGAVAPAFADWHKAFWDNLSASIELHRIKAVIAIDHRDCGAAKIAYGADRVKDRQAETETHRAALTEFRREVIRRQPQLAFETWLMDLDGSIEQLG